MLTSVLERIAGFVDDRAVLTGDDVASRSAGIWRSDHVRAGAIVRPTTTQQVSAILAVCNELRQPIVVHGGLTNLVCSALTEPHELVISMERMQAIEAVDALGRTMTVQAGAPLQRIQEGAAVEGLMFPLDLGARGSCQIGGNVATNAGGNRVIRYGMTRDNVLGLEAVLADGRVLSSMNRMLKNNAGYDLKHLFIGTEGTLGVVTRLVLRLREAPASSNLAMVTCEGFEQVTALLKHVDRGLGGALSAFEVMWGDYFDAVTAEHTGVRPPLPRGGAFYVLVEALGGDPQRDAELFAETLSAALESGVAADVVIAQSDTQARGLWAVRDGVEHIVAMGEPYIFDVSLAIGDMREYVQQVRSGVLARYAGAHCFTFGHLGDGNLHFAILVGDDGHRERAGVEACVYEPLAAVGGSVSAEHGIGLEKRDWLSVSRTATEIDVMRALKAALDPNGILNPGKVFETP